MSRIRSLAVLVPSWNGRRHLETCLPALRAQRDPGVPWRTMVLDNGSWDGTSEWLAEHHPEVELVRSDVNLGFCRGLNLLARRADADALAFLNDDTRPRKDWLAALHDALASAPADVAAVSGKIVDWSGERLDFGRGIMTFDGHAFQLDYRRPLDRARIPRPGAELLFACGGNMLIRRRAFLDAGGFDEDFFAYLEDVDLGWRLWSGGARVLFAPEAVVHHRSMATSDLLGHAHRGFLFERNAFLTVYKNYDAPHFERLMPAVIWTLLHRTQTLLVQNNPGGSELTLDPYAGHIANTAAHAGGEAAGFAPKVSPGDRAHVEPDGGGRPASSGDGSAAGAPASGVTGGDDGPAAGAGSSRASGAAFAVPPPASPSSTPPASSMPEMGLAEKWRAYGPKDFLRRGVRKALRAVLPRFVLDPGAGDGVPLLTDARSVAQLRAITYLLGHLDAAAARRRAIQARRHRPDRAIFERFPLAVVPTYPGDERLFESDAFADLLPEETLPIVRYRLDQVMELEE